MGRRRTEHLIGTGVALVTPFFDNGAIDFKSLEKLVNHNIENGVNYLVVLGTTAEAATLNQAEKQSVIDCVKATNAGRLPMVLGISGNNTAAVIEEYKRQDLTDYTAILTASPYYNRPSQEGIYLHYKSIAQQTDQNIVLYNVPGRTASNIEPATTLRLAKDFNNIVAIKEASPNFIQSTEIIKNKPSDFLVLSGDDELALPMILAGGSGVTSVIAQVLTKDYTQMIQMALKGDNKSAYQLHYQLLDIMKAIYKEGNPTGIKQLLAILEICENHTRLPLVAASTAHQQQLQQLYHQL